MIILAVTLPNCHLAVAKRIVFMLIAAAKVAGAVVIVVGSGTTGTTGSASSCSNLGTGSSAASSGSAVDSVGSDTSSLLFLYLSFT